MGGWGERRPEEKENQKGLVKEENQERQVSCRPRWWEAWGQSDVFFPEVQERRGKG